LTILYNRVNINLGAKTSLLLKIKELKKMKKIAEILKSMFDGKELTKNELKQLTKAKNRPCEKFETYCNNKNQAWERGKIK
jgi:hypothetical protein